MARISLDTGELSDKELGIRTDIARLMSERPTPANVRVVLTPHGNLIVPKAR